LRGYLIACLLLCGCEATVENAPKIHPADSSQVLIISDGTRVFLSVFEFDGCEYVLGHHAANDNMSTHKGNCKYCLERQGAGKGGPK
jgi:hypothetical protein